MKKKTMVKIYKSIYLPPEIWAKLAEHCKGRPATGAAAVLTEWFEKATTEEKKEN